MRTTMIREIKPAEYHLLEDFCYHLIFVPPGKDAPPRSVVFEPSVHVYIKDFGRPDDFCLVAEQDGRVVGAAWARILAEPGIKGYGYVDDRTPELAISVLPECRGKGLGTALLTTLIDGLALHGYQRLSLAVQKENPATALYRQLGFETVSENEEDYIMVRDLAKPWYEAGTRCLWRLFPIEVCAYNPDYPIWYQEEASSLGALLGGGGNIERISHIGSTAVPGLAAKPIIDILLEVAEDADLRLMLKRLKDDGWLIMSDERSPRLRIDLNKGYTPSGFAERVFHLHIVHTGDCDELFFRDWLRGHPEDCGQYAALKQGLVEKHRNDRDGYTEAKGAFVSKVMANSRIRTRV